MTKLSDLGYGPGRAPFTIIATDTKDPYGHIPVEQSILDGVGQSFGQCPYCIESRSGLQSVVDLQSGGPRGSSSCTPTSGSASAACS